jgi:nucleoside-triphosphatase THEP1
MAVEPPPIWMLTGDQGTGKTTFCRTLAARARLEGWRVGGLASPAVFDGDHKTGILVENLATGEMRPFAADDPHPPFQQPLGKWYIDPSAIVWGNQILKSNNFQDLLIVDELGPLELVHQLGWKYALETLHAGRFHLAVVVIRPALSDIAHQLWKLSEIISFDRTRSIDEWVCFYWVTMKALIHSSRWNEESGD